MELTLEEPKVSQREIVCILTLFSYRPSLGEFKRAQPFQKLIHIPKTGSICTKGNLARIIKKMKHLYGSIYSFTPLTIILPNEYKQVINYWNKDGNEVVQVKAAEDGAGQVRTSDGKGDVLSSDP